MKYQGKTLKKLSQKAQTLRKSVDERLLELAAVGSEQVKSKWSAAAEKWELDPNLPNTLVQGIIEKAKKVRETIKSDELIHLSKSKVKKVVAQTKNKATAKVRKRKTKTKV